MNKTVYISLTLQYVQSDYVGLNCGLSITSMNDPHLFCFRPYLWSIYMNIILAIVHCVQYIWYKCPLEKVDI
jgi:hypothetical protein